MLTHELLAIYEPTWAAICDVLELQRRGVNLTPGQAAERVGLGARTAAPSGADVAVIPLFGLLTPRRGGLLSMLFGGTSLADFAAAVSAAAANPRIGTIILQVDSPGGDVMGTPEAADAVANARQRKHIIAVADGLAASAAFWIAAQAHEVVASTSSQLGSIGVVVAHVEVSRAEEAAGLRTTILTSSRRKAEGNPHEPLGADARAYLQSRVDTAGAMFTAAVARGRGVPESRARGPEFGEGRVFFAEEAVKRGLADRVGTIASVISREVGRHRDAVQYENALAWWLELAAKGVDVPRPVAQADRDRAERLAQHKLDMASRGLL